MSADLTPAAIFARLAEIGLERRRLDEEAGILLNALAETIDRAEVAGARVVQRLHARAGDLLDSAAAEKFTGVSRDSLTRAARKDPRLGWKTPGSAWRFDKRELAARFLRAPADFAEVAEFAEPPPLSHGTECDQPLNGNGSTQCAKRI